MRRNVVPALILAGTMIVATSLHGDEREDCVSADHPEARVSACTTVIDSGARLGTNLAIAFNNRGTALDALGEHARAVEDYNRAIEINPDYAAAYYNRGRAYDALGQYAEAIESYDQAIELDPDFAEAYQNRGISYEGLGEYEQAQQDWRRSIEIAGTPRARWWQEYLKEHGHYAGAIDGLYGAGTEGGLLACARDPNC